VSFLALRPFAPLVRVPRVVGVHDGFAVAVLQTEADTATNIANGGSRGGRSGIAARLVFSATAPDGLPAGFRDALSTDIWMRRLLSVSPGPRTFWRKPTL
jgi:hypothetical protein